MNDNDIKIAVLEEQMKGLREQQKAHADETKKAISELDTKIDKLVEVMNKGKGAFAAAVALSGMLGAAAVKFLTFVLGR